MIFFFTEKIKKIKREYFFFILVPFFITAFIAVGLVFAQRPSFEIYPEGGHPEPDITNVNINQISNSLVTVTATITDLSGISSAWLVVRDSEDNEIEIKAMYDDGAHEDEDLGDDIYGVLILIDGYPTGTFIVDIFAVDGVNNKAELLDAGSFSIIGSCEEDEDVSLCIRLIVDASDLEGCVTDHGVCLKASIPAPDIPDIEGCVIDEDVCLRATTIFQD
ncbi:hypothetical protein KKC00_00440 [Patescibacteria group bacterium]|nr:hypothetical protein [Patescibacteria group bacterium]